MLTDVRSTGVYPDSTRIGKIPLHIPQKMARPSRGDKYLGRGRMDNVGLPSPTIIVMAH